MQSTFWKVFPKLRRFIIQSETRHKLVQLRSQVKDTHASNCACHTPSRPSPSICHYNYKGREDRGDSRDSLSNSLPEQRLVIEPKIRVDLKTKILIIRPGLRP